MVKVPFRVSARAARLIGRENVATSHGAVTELVKNAYDADAGACAVLFLPRWKAPPAGFSPQELELVSRALPAARDLVKEEAGQFKVSADLAPADKVALHRAVNQVLDLWIVDNGHGMSEDVINERWMVIGTDAKELDVRSRGGRIVTGAKGIGRFALDRLGRESELISGQPGGTTIAHWLVDWSDFEGAGKIVSDVEALLETEAQTLDVAYEEAGLTPLLPCARPERDGNAEPLSFATGTAIRIGLLYDAWDTTDSLRLKDTLASLLPPHDRADFDIFVYDHRSPTEGGYIENLPPDQFDYRLTAKVRGDGTVRVTLDRQEIDVPRIRQSVFDDEAMQQPGFTREDFQRGSYTFETDLNRLLKLETDAEVAPYLAVGPFDMTLYFLKLQNPSADNRVRYPQKNFDVSRRRAWLRNSGGIRLYRDNFRVRPFGEPGSQAYDWLLLGERVARNPAQASRLNWKVPPQQLAGTLYITKAANPALDDQSNREGIRNERAFVAFRTIVLALIGTFENDRSYILNKFNAAYERDNPPSADVEQAMRIVREYRRGSSEAGSASPAPSHVEGCSAAVPPADRASSDIQQVGDALESKVQEIAILRDDIQVMRGMATLGTILVSFTHELKQIKADMESRSDRLARAVDAVVDPKRLDEVPRPARPSSVLDRMRSQDEKVSRWVDFALSAVSPAKRRRRVIDIYTYLEGLRDYWLDFLNERQITIELAKRRTDELCVLAHEIDLDSIFYNLINNSVEAFVKPSAEQSREIKIGTGLASPGWLLVDYCDNGPGLSKELNVPDDIFEFGISTKKDDHPGEPGGTGIGMWLLRNVVHDYTGTVDLKSQLGEPGFEISIRLPRHRSGEVSDG